MSGAHFKYSAGNIGAVMKNYCWFMIRVENIPELLPVLLALSAMGAGIVIAAELREMVNDYASYVGYSG